MTGGYQATIEAMKTVEVVWRLGGEMAVQAWWDRNRDKDFSCCACIQKAQMVVCSPLAFKGASLVGAPPRFYCTRCFMKAPVV